MADVVELFHRSLGRPPTLVVRAPGRVNLIGEHIDYNGLSVLPMAIQRAVRLAVAPRADGLVHVVNADPDFGERSFHLQPDIDPYPTGDWGNYPKAAAQALAREHGARVGFDAVVDSDVPVAAGLSSSSALVVGVGLAVAAVNEIEIGRRSLGALMARAERYVGTMGGGMDQAVSLGAVAGHACRIDFGPLTLTPVPVPSDWRFVVASSLVPAEKSGAAREAYNLRTAECREALRAVGTAMELPAGVTPPHGAVDTAEADGTSDSVGSARAVTRPDPASLLTYKSLMASAPVVELLEAARAALPPTLLRRFRHVVTEAGRVTAAEEALRRADLETMGQLMRDSHASLRDDYEVSSAELDELVGIAMDAGAAGARLTGAGFGGCIVALARASAAGSVMDGLGSRFYGPAGIGRAPGDHLFVAEPSGGASVTEL
jgi:galactokinase